MAAGTSRGPNRMTPAFRLATSADLPAIVRMLADDPLGAGRERDEAPLPPVYAAGFAAMSASGGRIVVAELDGAVVACLQLTVIHGVAQLGLTRAQVEAVRVAAPHRGRGIGGALMRHAIGLAREDGCALVQLTTNAARTDAQRFYERLGFAPSHVGMKLSLPR